MIQYLSEMDLFTGKGYYSNRLGKHKQGWEGLVVAGAIACMVLVGMAVGVHTLGTPV